MFKLKMSNGGKSCARRLGVAACVVTATLAAAPLCQAQDAEPAAPAVHESTESAPRLAEVTVTATRVRRPAQKVAAPILVIPMERLQTEQINNYIDLARLAPSLNITSTFGVAQVFMRGLGIISANSGEESSVGVYIDGAYVARPEAQLTSMFDVKRVEVLEGPQGQLFGRNTIGGALNITTNGPSRTPEGYARVTFGNYNKINTAAAIGGPLTANGELRGRFAFQTENHSGFGKNEVNDGQVDDNNRRMARLELEYIPNDRFNTLFSGEYYYQDDHEGSLHFGGESFPNIPSLQYLGQGFQSPNPRDANSSITNPKLKVGSWNFTDTTNFTLNDHIAFTSILNYRHFRQDRLQDLGLSAALIPLGPPFGDGSSSEGRTIMSNQKSLELQMKYGSEWINGIVGFYYFYELQTSNGHVGFVPGSLIDPTLQSTYLSIMADPTIETVNGVPISPTQPYPVGTAFFTCRLSPALVNTSTLAPDFFCDRINQKTNSVAAYTQWRLGLGKFSPALEPFGLKFGFRYTTELHDVGDLNHTIVPLAPGVGLLTLNSIAPIGGVPGDTNKERFNDSSPDVGLTWQITPDDMFYYTYSEGFKAGSALETGELNAQGTMKISLPEKIWNNEFGIKTMWFHNRLLVDANGFYYRLSNLQVQKVLSTPTGFDFILSNGAETAAHGAELQFEALPTSQLTVGGTVAWLESKFTQFTTQDPLNPIYIPSAVGYYNPSAPDVSVAGNYTPNSPEWTAEFHADYQIPGLTLPDEGTLTLGGDVHYQSTTYFSEFNRLIEGQSSYAVGDMHLIYESGDGHWSAEAWVNNISDELIKDGSFPLSGLNDVGVTYLPPRTFGLTLGYKL